MKPFEKMTHEELWVAYNTIKRFLDDKTPKSAIEQASDIMEKFESLEGQFSTEITIKVVVYLAPKPTENGSVNIETTFQFDKSFEETVADTTQYLTVKNDLLEKGNDLLNEIRKIAGEYQLDYENLVSRAYFSF